MVYLRAVLWVRVRPPDRCAPCVWGRGWLGMVGALCQIRWVRVQIRLPKMMLWSSQLCATGRERIIFPVCLFPFLVQHAMRKEEGDCSKLPWVRQIVGVRSRLAGCLLSNLFKERRCFLLALVCDARHDTWEWLSVIGSLGNTLSSSAPGVKLGVYTRYHRGTRTKFSSSSLARRNERACKCW